MPAVIQIVIYAFYAFIFLTSLLEAVFPKWCWKTFESWKATKEPSKAYFFGKRIAGVIGMVLIAAIASAPTLAAYFSK